MKFTEIFEYFSNILENMVHEIFSFEISADTDDDLYQIYNITNGDKPYPDDWKDGIKIAMGHPEQQEDVYLNPIVGRVQCQNYIEAELPSLIL